MARETGCDCVHPGYGFLSENEAFAQAVIDAGLVWIGPPPEAIRQMGVKTEARELMQAAGVPLVPGYQGGGDDQAFLEAADRIGYPVMVKAAGGGGGKGIRVVEQPADLAGSAAARLGARHSTLSAMIVFFWNAISKAGGTSKFRYWPTSTGRRFTCSSANAARSAVTRR